jgi:hypothetical protein
MGSERGELTHARVITELCSAGAAMTMVTTEVQNFFQALRRCCHFQQASSLFVNMHLLVIKDVLAHKIELARSQRGVHRQSKADMNRCTQKLKTVDIRAQQGSTTLKCAVKFSCARGTCTEVVKG